MVGRDSFIDLTFFEKGAINKKGAQPALLNKSF